MSNAPKFLLLVIINFSLTQCRQRAEQSIYLIPEGFTGNVVIMFNQPDGAPSQYHAGKRQYLIPANGLLKTKFSPNIGLHEPNRYYYTNTKGQKTTQLQYFTDLRQLLPNDIICCHYALVTDGETPRNHYAAFVIAKVAQADSISRLQNAVIDKLAPNTSK